MANTARLYRIEALIRARGHVSFASLLQELEVSPATLKRDLEYLRSRLGAPIVYDAALNAYRFASGNATPAGPRQELPGLWFDEAELYSLLMAQQLLASLDSGGLISRHLQPLLDRIGHLLGSGEGQAAAARLMKRVKIASTQRRPVPTRCFERVSTALLSRRRLQLRYFTRARGQASDREVSPQRLVHYRHTWYLDAWCHRVDALRRFALDAIEQASVIDKKARDLPLKQVAAAMDGGYGIFAGSKASGAASQGGAAVDAGVLTAGAVQWAVLRFDPQAARWASREEWHPQQQGSLLADGSFELTLPYGDDTELVMDILRQGPQVQVMSPAALVARVRTALAQAAARYTA